MPSRQVAVSGECAVIEAAKAFQTKTPMNGIILQWVCTCIFIFVESIKGKDLDLMIGFSVDC